MATAAGGSYNRGPMFRLPKFAYLVVVALALAANTVLAQYHRIDLAEVTADSGELLRVHGSSGNGAFGVPVAGGRDCDGDGLADYALAAMLASPLGRDRAGLIQLVFGDGTIAGIVDTSIVQPRVLRIAGSARQENAGNEMWIDDVTGDGIADLMIGRQNYSFTAALAGNGALSIIAGGPALRQLAEAGEIIDLRQPPAELTMVTLIGGQRSGRLGMWVRSGDVDGDGIADVLLGADQEDHIGETHSGSVYVIRGGAHLGASRTVSLADLASSGLSGDLARIDPPAGTHLHFGATCQAADLDNDGRQEVLIAAALNRAGGVLAPFNAGGSSDGVGGTAHGSLYIVWDDNFPAGRWPDTFVLRVGSAGLVHSTIDGGQRNAKFGEEILGGLDYDADGRADLFVGDLTTDLSPGGTQPDSGAGYVFYDASQLKGQTFSLDAPPGALRLSVMFGEIRGAITGDTAIDGDFDGDGIADLAVGSPHAAPLDRQDAGVLHVFFGKPGGWPAVIDVSRLDQIPALRSTEVLGARGWVPGNDGDVLGYSIAAGDVNGDGRSDIVINEMEGDGLAAKTIDVGNLLVLDGALVATAVDRVDCPIQPRDDCRAAAGGSSSLRVHQEQRRLRWRWRAATAADLPPPPASYAVCLYDSASRALRGILELEPPSVCESCWSDPVAGVRRYRGPTTGTTVVQSAVFRGGSGRRPQFELRARDWRSTLAEGPWSLPATVQLIGADRCWQAEFGSPRRNDGHQLLARQPRR